MSLKLLGMDLGLDNDKTVITFCNGSRIESIPCCNTIRGKRSESLWYAYEDEKYGKHLKRVRNRQKLYNKLKKLGRV